MTTVGRLTVSNLGLPLLSSKVLPSLSVTCLDRWIVLPNTFRTTERMAGVRMRVSTSSRVPTEATT